MVWYRNVKSLWLIIAILVVAVGGQAVLISSRSTPSPEIRTQTLEIESPACIRAAKAGRQMAKAAGAALYVAPGFPPLVRDALAAGDDQAKVANVLEHLRASSDALRKAKIFSESGHPPAWKRFQKWNPRCLREP